MCIRDRVREKLGQEEAEEFIVKNTDGTYRFLKKEIRWFYSDKRKVMLVTDRGEYGFYAKLDEVEKQLKDGGEAGQFVRIHQRYLVNTKWVDQIGSASVQIGGEELPISRAYKEAAVKKLAEAMLGGKMCIRDRRRTAPAYRNCKSIVIESGLHRM